LTCLDWGQATDIDVTHNDSGIDPVTVEGTKREQGNRYQQQYGSQPQHQLRHQRQEPLSRRTFHWVIMAGPEFEAIVMIWQDATTNPVQRVAGPDAYTSRRDR
jgi:hypothetical protein